MALKRVRMVFGSRSSSSLLAGSRAGFPVACLLFCTLLTISGCGFRQSQQTSPPAQTTNQAFDTLPGAFSSLHMISAELGWAVSQDIAGGGAYTILRTIDGGGHWTATLQCLPTQSQGRGYLEPCSTDFRSATVATVVQPEYDAQTQASQLRIFHTADGGMTWQSSVLAARDLETAATFVDVLHGWALVAEHFPGPDPGSTYIGQDISLYRTSNGGQTWQRVASGPATSQLGTTSDDAYGVAPLTANAHLAFSSPTTGWLVGQTYRRDGSNQGWLYTTQDGGVTWHPSSLVLAPGASAAGPPVFFTPQDGALFISLSSSPSQNTQMGVFYVTRNGGRTWSGTPLPFAITDSAAIDLQQAWVTPIDAGSILYTTSDGWRHWTKMQMGLTFGRIYDLSFISPTTGWAFGDDLMDALHGPGGGLRKGDVIALLKTTDGGQNWRELARSQV